MTTHMADVSTLETEMLVRRPYPAPLKEKVATMVRAWEGFIALPAEVKQQFGYSNDYHLSGAGYELKTNGIGDLKEDFHVRRDHADFLYGEARRIGSPEALAFLDAAYRVYDDLDAHISAIISDIEVAYTIPNLLRDLELYKETLIIRLLHYFGDRKAGDVFGDPHPDKGAFTGHLYESDSGVERLTTDGTWVSMDVAHDEALFFAGLGLQHRSKCAIKAVWHRIVANVRTAKRGRVSAVCFSNFANNRYYDKVKHGRTQDLPLGESYTQSFEEFDRLFMDAPN